MLIMLIILATIISLASVILCELLGLEKLTNGFGLLCMVRGLTAIAGPPILGNYNPVFKLNVDSVNMVIIAAYSIL